MAEGASASTRPSIISPVVDFLCVGGLSLIVLVPLLLSGQDQLNFLNIGWLLWAQALVNYTHFMASYRIVYRDREMIRRHQWAAIWVPPSNVQGVAIKAQSAQSWLRLAPRRPCRPLRIPRHSEQRLRHL